MGPGIQVEDETVEVQGHLFISSLFPNGDGLFQEKNLPDNLQKFEWR